MPGRTYESARERILDAAERIILRGGMSELSVEAVITEAGLSKGGFFHHFAKKDALIIALLERLVGRVGAHVTALAAKDPEPRGARLRAQIALAFDAVRIEAAAPQALLLAFMEAARTQPEMKRRASEINADAVARDAAEGVPEAHAILIQFALDGFWLAESIGTAGLTREQKQALRGLLLALARPEPGRDSPRKTRARATKKG